MGSFSFKGGVTQIDGTIKKFKKAQEDIQKQQLKAMTNSVEVVYRTASSKRPMITPRQTKQEGRKKPVSNPLAALGVPVDTGELQASIKKEVVEKGESLFGRVWTDNNHAGYMEFGTSRIKARPFMRPALTSQADYIKKQFRKK